MSGLVLWNLLVLILTLVVIAIIVGLALFMRWGKRKQLAIDADASRLPPH
ncbi:MAG TPA: hypothetical protein VGP24_11910 [Glaciihabitans sp.]|jgi:hypothetical protein|nr:hypothetical protein [Glaciihabitans sp.]